MQNIIGTVKMIFPPHSRRQPIEDLDPRRHRDHHRGEDEERIARWSHAHGEHVVRPYAQADKADADRCSHHRRITEDGLAREDGDDLVDEARTRAAQERRPRDGRRSRRSASTAQPSRQPAYRRNARQGSGQAST